MPNATPARANERKAPRRKASRDRRFAISAAGVRRFSKQGLEARTIDDGAAAAGIAPRTFFRHFATKEEAAFPDHAERIEDLRCRLAQRAQSIDPLAAVLDASHESATEYLTRPDLYRERFQLSLANPALRDRERLIDLQYERVLSEYLARELAGQPAASMRAEAIAAAIVAAINHTLYHWAEAPDAEASGLLEEGLATLKRIFTPMLGPTIAYGVDTVTVTIPAHADLQDSLARALQDATPSGPAAAHRRQF